jgi:hypothetical protein
MHPRDAEGFEWDEANESELGQPDHPVMPWEVEQVFWNRPVWPKNKKGRSGDHMMVGRTRGGRKLTIIVQAKPTSGLLRAITGWDSTPAELSKYGRKGRR